jgi:hypothetical protein
LKRTGRIGIPRRALEFKFKGKRTIGRPSIRWFGQISRIEKSWQEIEMKRLKKTEGIWGFSSIDPYKTDTCYKKKKKIHPT